MADNVSELTVQPPGEEPWQTKTPIGDEPVAGRWYWVDTTDGPWLACVIAVGSNYVELEGPSTTGGGTTTDRIHFNEFWDHCTYVPDPDPIIDGKIASYQAETRRLIAEVHALAAKLGVPITGTLPEQASSETQALSIRKSEPVKKYKQALIKAKEKTLPDLFEKIKVSNKNAATWMKVKLVPLVAEAKRLTGVVDGVKDRIFNVELYAGLIETVVLVKEGAAAGNDEKIHLMQRRCYMDEECLAGYEAGGMDYSKIEDFERWLCKPANFERLFPFPKTVVAFRIRRDEKERDIVDLRDFFRVLEERQADKATFLYIRNGEQLHRLETEIEFEEKLFPDMNHRLFSGRKLWAKIFFHGIDDLITDDDYQERIKQEAIEEEELKKVPEKDRWWKRKSYWNTKEQYQPFTPDNVYFDDIAKEIASEAKKHNRLVLVLQGLLDRSQVFHPHPPWQLWTSKGFAAAFDLHFDDTRALSPGDKPDFDAYQARLNAHLCEGSLTVGQQRAWLMAEADKENRRLDNDWRNKSSYRHTYFQPHGNPGPGKIARVARYRARDGACTYTWDRERLKKARYGLEGGEIRASFTTGEENVLNIDAYKPGDFHIFYDDPRTRREYLKWAPLLLEAEECHAGNRDVKPNRALPAARPPVVRGRDRGVDLSPAKERPKAPLVADRWVGKKVRLLYDIELRNGERYKHGTVCKVSSYERKKLTLTVAGADKKWMRAIPTWKVEILPDAEQDEPKTEGES